MALTIVEALDRAGRIDPDTLALAFARGYRADPDRGYGLTVRRVLDDIADGMPWPEAAGQVYGGLGSMGNGGAMRVAPVGAYFADDLRVVVEQARASAATTHAHPEAQAGAIAVAVAAAYSSRVGPYDGRILLSVVLDQTPAGDTRSGIERAASLPFSSPVPEAVELLGNGSRITAPDTVPFALWCAARHLDNYTEGLWAVASAGGDNDTNAAIVGGIIALANPEGTGALSLDWLAAREVLKPLGPSAEDWKYK